MLGPQSTAHRHRGKDQFHALFKIAVLIHLCFFFREKAEVNAFRIARLFECSMDAVRNERDKGGDHPAQISQNLEQGRVGFQFVGTLSCFPESPAAAADVPVG